MSLTWTKQGLQDSKSLRPLMRISVPTTPKLKETIDPWSSRKVSICLLRPPPSDSTELPVPPRVTDRINGTIFLLPETSFIAKMVMYRPRFQSTRPCTCTIKKISLCINGINRLTTTIPLVIKPSLVESFTKKESEKLVF